MSLSQKKQWKPKPLHYLCNVYYNVHLCTLCFRWACMFGIMSGSFFLQTLAFPSLWSIKSVHKTLSQNFWGSSPILLANEWFASSGVASVLLFMKSSANSRLWYLHSCPLEVVADVSNICFRGLSLQLSQCFCRQLLMFSLIYPFKVCYLVHQWFLSSSGDSKWLYLLLAVFVQ